MKFKIKCSSFCLTSQAPSHESQVLITFNYEYNEINRNRNVKYNLYRYENDKSENVIQIVYFTESVVYEHLHGQFWIKTEI